MPVTKSATKTFPSSPKTPARKKTVGARENGAEVGIILHIQSAFIDKSNAIFEKTGC